MLKSNLKKPRSPLMVIFTTVFIDLVGFGMVIPLVGLYGRHYGATPNQLALLGGIYSLMQFFFAPVWGKLSDRIGRRPVLLMSLLGSTIAYLIFGLAPSFSWLLASRAFAGIFAANISTAQAYVADITSVEDRAKGMGMIGAAFGIGFTFGPPLGGIASAHLGIAAPGLIASAICLVNLSVAYFRLPESFPPEERQKKSRDQTVSLRLFLKRILVDYLKLIQKKELLILMLTFFFVTFAFSTMEQTLSLLLQTRFHFLTGEAGLKTGLVLMVAGLCGVVIQGGLIRTWVPRFGEVRLIVIGLVLNAALMTFFSQVPSYNLYFFVAPILAFGSGLLNPSLYSLISKSANAQSQGAVLGLSQSLGSLARALGPFCGLQLFSMNPNLPYWVASGIYAILGGVFLGTHLIAKKGS